MSGWVGKRVTVMGLGTRAGGVGVARYLAEAGAIVTVTDLRTERRPGRTDCGAWRIRHPLRARSS